MAAGITTDRRANNKGEEKGGRQMIVVCNHHDPPRVLNERPPLEDKTEISAICPECYQRMQEEENFSLAILPGEMKSCDIIRVHDDGDLTVQCQGTNFILTTGGEIFKEATKNDLSVLDKPLEDSILKEESVLGEVPS
jgi:hypothetical protein